MNEFDKLKDEAEQHPQQVQEGEQYVEKRFGLGGQQDQGGQDQGGQYGQSQGGQDQGGQDQGGQDQGGQYGQDQGGQDQQQGY
jgi:hypothetical protein